MDEAWCVCRALVHLKQANATEEALYQQYRTQELRKAKGILDEDSWSLLRAEDEDKVVTAIFALIWDGPVMKSAGPPKSFQLKPKEKLTVEGQTGVMAKIFQNAARVLNAPLPHVYVQPHRTGRLLLASVIEDGRLTPAVIVGRDLMSGFRDTEIAFAVASMLALLRPAYYLRLALPALEELEAALAAAAGLSGRPFAARRPETAALIESFAIEIQRRLTPPAAERLRDLVKRLSERPDLRRWRNAVDTAGRHAGLLVCGDLGAAASMIAAEPAPADGPRPADKVRELVVWSVSSNYFAARRHLGITVT
jgi:hypothetical protein